jgi:DNA-binding CsgD family transcriptional regulator
MPAGDERFQKTAHQAIVALEHVPLPTALLNSLGIIEWQNRASLALRGSRLGRRFVEFIAPDDRGAAEAAFENILTNGGPTELTVRVLNTDGEYVFLQGRWVLVSARGACKVVLVIALHELSASEHQRPAIKHAMLTTRQLEILRLLAAAKSTRQIAQELSIARTTTRNHSSNLLGALGVHSRLQAVVIAREAGLLER